jgi:hypothetical protein
MALLALKGPRGAVGRCNLREAIRWRVIATAAGRSVLLALIGAFAVTLGSQSVALAQRGRAVGPRPPISPIYRPRPGFAYPRVRPFGYYRAPFYSFRLGSGFSGIWWPQCGEAWTYLCYPNVAIYQPLYFYGGPIERPELIFKDGTTYTVKDYWVVDNQLHFKTVEEGGTMSREQTRDFDQLDLQKTVDSNAQRGFRFVLRNEPMEQYFKDHPEVGTPGAALPPAVAPSAPGQGQTGK